MSSLFRKEVVKAQSQRLLGSISLAQPIKLKGLIGLLILIAISIIVFLFNAEYSRKETVNGFLRPDKGLINSYAKRNSTVKSILVKQGQTVKTGEPLMVLVVNNDMVSGNDLNQISSEELNKQIGFIEEELTQLKLIENKERKYLNDQKNNLRIKSELNQNRKHLMLKKLAIIEKEKQRYNSLNNKGYLSNLDLQRQQSSFIDAKQELAIIDQSSLQIKSETDKVHFQQLELPQKFKSKERQYKQQKSRLIRQLNESKNNYSYLITASHAGIVTAIQAFEGETINSLRPLLTLLPKGAKFVAELLLPTRSAGFIKLDDLAKLRFDAFPYQRFGFIDSTISRIDNTLITEKDVNFPIRFSEPVYRVRAQLSEQFIQAYGKQFQLKSGMLLKADIILKKQTLIDWLLDPIYSLKGRLN